MKSTSVFVLQRSEISRGLEDQEDGVLQADFR